MAAASEETPRNDLPFVLAVGGIDPSGGAGILVDCATLTACGVHSMSAVTALTVQNSRGISRVVPSSPEDLRDQMLACLEDFPIHWVKTGILPEPELVRVVAEVVQNHSLQLVVDPIIKSGKGFPFAGEDIVDVYIEELFPRAAIITPNLFELQEFAMLIAKEGDGFDLESIPSISTSEKLRLLGRAWGTSILTKGGHGTGKMVVDRLWNEGRIWRFSRSRLPFQEIHGSGCVLASAITAFCARMSTVPAAVAEAEQFFEIATQAAYTWNETTFLTPLFPLVSRGHESLLVDEVARVVSIFEHHPSGAAVIPEVRSNVSIIGLGGKDRNDVAAVDGRITLVGGHPHAAGPIRLACSDHTARLLLACRQVDPRVRAVTNLRYAPENLIACESAGLQCVEVLRGEEPSQKKQVEHGTMEWLPTQVKHKTVRFPDVIYDTGDMGKEPMIRLFGRSGEDLASKLGKMLDQIT